MQLRVLIVEDNEDGRQLIATALRSIGHVTVEASNGTEGLHQFTSMVAAKLPPNVVVTDLWMPGMRGLSFISCIRSAGCTCPAVLVTAHDHPDVRAQAEALDVKTLRKPFEVDELQRLVSELGG